MAPEPTNDARTPRDELADRTAHGALYLERLRQRQLALSVMALIAFGALVGILPLVIDLLPSLRQIDLIGVPIDLWLLAVPAAPIFLTIATLYVRRADALDENFRRLVRRR